jgi:hypothetical protein
MMKLRVACRSGAVERLDLEGPLTIEEGPTLNVVRTESGIEHFFTKDGYYDGWGTMVGPMLANKEPVN